MSECEHPPTEKKGFCGPHSDAKKKKQSWGPMEPNSDDVLAAELVQDVEEQLREAQLKKREH